MDKIKKIFKIDALMLLGVLIYSVAVLISSFQYDFTTGIFPRVIAGFMVLVVAYMLIIRILFYLRSDISLEKKNKRLVRMPWYISLVLMVVYFFLIYLIGLPAASAVYLFVSIVLLGYQRRILALVYAVLFCAVFFGTFIYFLGVPMPDTIFGM